jgi:hypothetical protein
VPRGESGLISRGRLLGAAGLCAAASFAAEARAAPRDPAELLAALHADAGKYVRAVRVVSLHAAAVSPEAIYSGLVRPGGRDPRLPEDAPRVGRGERNDVVVFASALDPARSPGWLLLILDHEFFHARHLARGGRTPLADFADDAANHHYYEATAWSYVVDRALRGAYGELGARDLREAAGALKRHRDAIRTFILGRQPSAWTHYERFMAAEGPDPPPRAARAGPASGADRD